jgi:Peptidase family M48
VGRRPLYRFLHPLRRLEALKILAGIAVLAVTLAQHAPPELTAKTVPGWAQDRLVDGVIADDAPRRCSRQGGDAAVRKLLVRLDPALGWQVEIVALRNGGFVVTATPGKHIFMMQSALTEVDPLALPALLAHELSHVRHGDPMVAILRENGFLKTWAAIFEGNPENMLRMRFSGLEERRADLEAMQMMRNAGVPIEPAAKMFEQFLQSKEQGGYFGFDQRDFHFGIDARVQRWAAAARFDQPSAPPVLTDSEQGEVFNFCWNGPIKPLPKSARQAPPVAASPGTGSIGGALVPRFRDPR